VIDAAEAFQRLLHIEMPNEIAGHIINIGRDDQNLQINTVAETIAQFHSNMRNRSVSIRHSGPQDVRSYRVSFGKMKKLLSWEPGTPWQTALTNITNFLNQHQDADFVKCHTLDWYGLNGIIEAQSNQPSVTLQAKSHIPGNRK